MKPYQAVVVAACLACAGIEEAGASILFTDRASFNSAVQVTSVAMFENYSGASATDLGKDYTEDGIDFSSSFLDMYSLNPINYDLFGTGRALWTTSASVLTGTGPGAFRALGVNLRAVYKNVPSDFSIAFSNGAHYDLHSDGTASFFGVLLDNAVTSFSISTSAGPGAIYDDVMLGSAALPLPLPGTVPLMVAGLTLLAWRRRSQRVG